METTAIDQQAASRPAHQLNVPTVTEVDAASVYEAYTVHVRYDRELDFGSRYSECAGRRVRWAGQVQVVPDRKRFYLRLASESREADLELLHAVVAEVRTGRWNAWEWDEFTSPKTGSAWYTLTPGTSNMARPLGRYIVPCTTTGCVRQGSHDFKTSLEDDVFHGHVDSVVTEEYALKLQRFGDEPWKLNIDQAVFDLDAAAVRRLVNDLAWLRGTLTKLNAAQEMLRHDSLNSTQIYTGVSPKRVQEPAAARPNFDVPVASGRTR